MRSFAKAASLILLAVIFFCVASTSVFAATYWSRATGNWNSNTTWSLTDQGAAVGAGIFPGAADSVLIVRGFTVTVNINNAACSGMRLGNPTGGGGSGTLAFNAGSQLTSSKSLYLGGAAVTTTRLGNITMTNGGTLICQSLVQVSSTVGTWTPGTGTVQFTTTNTIPASPFTSFNNLVIGGGTTSIAVATTIDSLIVNSGAGFSIPAFGVTISSLASVSGTLSITSATGTKTFTGNVIVNNGGTWNNSANSTVSFAGNLQNDGTFTAGTAIQTFTGAAKTYSGVNPISIPSITISGTYTNNGTLTVSTALAGAGTLTNGATGILNIGQATAPAPTITATAAGNTVNYNAAGAQTIKATTYSNLTLSGSGAKTVTGSTVNGTLSLQGTATAAGTIPTYGGSAVIEYAGSGAQTTGIEMGAAVAPGVKINNASGVTLSANKTFNGTLTFTTGKLATGANTLTAGTISGASTTSYVNGNLLKTFPTGGPTTRTFEVGDAGTYAPVSVTINNVTVAGSLTTKTTGSEHPNIATSGLNSSKDVNRYWTLTNTAMTFNNYSTTLNWQAGDVDGGANTSNFIAGKFNTPNWALATSTGQTVTSVTASGLTSFSDFAVGEPASFTITASAGANGSISPSGAVSVTNGNNQHFSIVPNTGYHVDSLIVDGTPIAADTQYTFNNVTANHTIRAAFAINQYTITATAGSNGSISPNGSVAVNYNNNQHFSITANTGYHVDSLVIDGTPVAVDSQYTFNNVTANHTIHVAFAIDQFTITATAGANGMISPSGAVVVDYNNNQHFSVAANTGYHVDSLVIDGTPIAVDTQYTFNNVTTNHTIHVAFVIDQFTVTATAGANGMISPSGAVVVDYNNNQHFSIAANTGYHVDSLIIDGTPIAVDTQYTFNNVTANHTIHVAFAIDQFTATATSGANGSITPSGAVVVDYNNNQHFSIAANTGYHVDSLIIDGTPIAVDTQYTFNNVTANHTIHVAFALDQFTITATAGANGSVSPSGVVNASYGDNVHFSIAANTGYHVDSLIIDGTPIAADTQYTFNNVTANHTIHVAFAIDVFTITPSAGSNGDISPLAPVNVNYGDSTTFTFTPVDGYHVDSIFIDGVGQPGKAMHLTNVKGRTAKSGVVVTYTFHNVTANHTIHVTFAINGYTVTADAGSNGSITPNGVVAANYGDNVHFSIAANAGYHIDSLVIDGTPVAVDTQYTFNSISANHTIHVAFAIDVFVITPSAGANGDISPSTPVNVNYGDSATFTLTPIDGYHVDSIFIDGVGQPGKAMHLTNVKLRTAHSGVVVTYTFHNVTANHTINATFAINSYTVTATAGANGTITPSGVVNANFGDNVHFNIAPNAGYHVDSLVIDGSVIAADTQYTFNSVAANHTISVTFALTGFTITATAGTHGAISPSGSVFVQQDSSKTFTMTPDAGYLIDSVLVDEVEQVVAGTYTFNAVTAAHTIRVVFKAGPYNISIASGNWSDAATWSLGTVPVNTDSVIITSGTTVTLDVNGICGALNLAGKLFYSNNAARTLTVSTAGSLSGDVNIADTLAFATQSNQRMFVGGGLLCSGAIVSNSTGSTGSFFVFNGSGTKTIASAVPLRGLQMSNPALELTLIQPLSISSGILLNAGKIVLGSHDLTLEAAANSDTGNTGSYVVTNGTGRLKQTVTTATATFPVGTGTSFNRVTLAAQTASDVFGIGILSSVNPSSAKDSAAVQRTIDMSRAGSDSLGLLTLTFGWDVSEQGPLFVPASAASWRYDGTAWVEEGTFVPAGTGPYVGTISNIVNTGKFAIGNAGALPITLAEFRGVTLDAHTVKIDWTTMSEQNTYGFYIQRRSDKSPVYSDISVLIAGAGTTVNEQHAYSWTDSKATEGVYYYRLRTLDLNGDVEYSAAIKVNIVLGVKDRIPVAFKLNQNYPNPFNPSTKIAFDLPENGIVTLRVYNVIGQEVATLLNNVQYNAGSFTETFNAGSFSSGVYYYRITVQGMSHNYQSLNKMMLVK
jgi:hypothetical protein